VRPALKEQVGGNAEVLGKADEVSLAQLPLTAEDGGAQLAVAQ